MIEKYKQLISAISNILTYICMLLGIILTFIIFVYHCDFKILMENYCFVYFIKITYIIFTLLGCVVFNNLLLNHKF